MEPKLRIPENEIRAYLGRYDYEVDPKLNHIRVAAREQKYLTRNQLYEVALWKSRRRAALVNKNEESFVREITEFAFKATHEHSRIGALVLLAGIHYPTASVVLHFCVDDSYPILDFRAIWSLGMEQPSVYTPKYWVKYTGICRSLAKEHTLSVRELDMALWQFSRENQGEV